MAAVAGRHVEVLPWRCGVTRKSKPRRACPMCKAYKYLGNGKDRRPIRDLRRLQDDTRQSGRGVRRA